MQLDERAAQVRFEITKYDFRPKLHDKKLITNLLQPF